MVKCIEEDSCRRLALNYTSGNYTMNCSESDDPCYYTSVVCSPNGHCIINCHGIAACWESTFNCPVGGNCIFNLDGQSIGFPGFRVNLTCQKNSNSEIYCAARYACSTASIQ